MLRVLLGITYALLLTSCSLPPQSERNIIDKYNVKVMQDPKSKDYINPKALKYVRLKLIQRIKTDSLMKSKFKDVPNVEILVFLSKIRVIPNRMDKLPALVSGSALARGKGVQKARKFEVSGVAEIDKGFERAVDYFVSGITLGL